MQVSVGRYRDEVGDAGLFRVSEKEDVTAACGGVVGS